MCRFIVYRGPAINMASLVIDPEHSMLQLARKAHCHYTPVNVDGFGVSWYLPGADIPLPNVYKDVVPAYESPKLQNITRAITSPCFFAHVRAASLGAVTYPNCHPFTFKNISFMHNGTVPYFRQIQHHLASRISKRAHKIIQGSTDSETMFALFITNFEREMGSTTSSSQQDPREAYEYLTSKQDQTECMVSALKTTLRQVHFLILQHEYENEIQCPPAEELTELDMDGADRSEPLPPSAGIGRLNLAVSDGQTICTSRYVSSRPETAHTLYYSTGSHFDAENCKVALSSSSTTEQQPAVIVTSEPLSKGFNCEEVPVNHMVVSGPNAYFSVESCS